MIMNEIPELKADLAFLKKFDSRSKTWKEFDGCDARGKGKLHSNFVLHPKRLASDSECSSEMDTPRKILTTDILKDLSLNEQNNNIHKRIHHTISQTVRIDDCYIETGIGDGAENKKSTTKAVAMALSKKSKVRPSSSFIDSFDKKFKNLVERSLKILNNIRELIEEGIPQPDGAEDFARRTKRLQEFSSRFSRVYLYPLLRQTDELSMPEKMAVSVINQKFIYSQQLVLQALQAYYTHLPSSVGKCGSDKLRSLLDQILYMCHLYELLKKGSDNENCEFINALRSHVEQLSETLTVFDMKFTEKKGKSSEVVTKKPKPQGNKVPNSNKNKSKLSMYLVSASFRKDLSYKQAINTLKRKKFSGVNSRYKTAGFKHRPPVEKKETEVPITFKLSKNSQIVRSTPRKSPIKEDDIKTMVELDSELEGPPNTGENLNHENSIASSRPQLVQDSIEINDDFVEGNVEKALEVLRNFFGNSENKQTEFLERIANEVDRRKEGIAIQEKTDAPKKKLKPPYVTITGAKNAKLICIRDDNSVIDDDEPCRRDQQIMTDVEVELFSSQTQTELKNDKRFRNKSGIKISRLPKTNRRVLTLLPKDYAINVIQYKLRYNHFHKHNPLYRKSAHIQPWILMGRISDDLLDHILQSVTGELEVNEILENLYNSEFQY